MIEIVELQSLTQAQALDVKALMGELSPGIEVSPDDLIRVAEAPGTHFFAAVDTEGRIVGCASLCVFVSPTGRKAYQRFHIDDRRNKISFLYQTVDPRAH